MGVQFIHTFLSISHGQMVIKRVGNVLTFQILHFASILKWYIIRNSKNLKTLIIHKSKWHIKSIAKFSKKIEWVKNFGNFQKLWNVLFLLLYSSPFINPRDIHITYKMCVYMSKCVCSQSCTPCVDEHRSSQNFFGCHLLSYELNCSIS